MDTSTLLILVVAGIVFFWLINWLSSRKQRTPDQRPQYQGAISHEAMSVEELLRAGRKIEAIKLYRTQTGVGLKEAKDAVDAMAGGTPVARPAVQSREAQTLDRAAIENSIRAGQKIQAIKAYREQTGVGLKEAKDAVEQIAIQLTATQPHDRTAIEDALRDGKKIIAIKLYREQNPEAGLKEAKDAVEEIATQMQSR